jgi:hypothetical protein
MRLVVIYISYDCWAGKHFPFLFFGWEVRPRLSVIRFRSSGCEFGVCSVMGSAGRAGSVRVISFSNSGGRIAWWLLPTYLLQNEPKSGR